MNLPPKALLDILVGSSVITQEQANTYEIESLQKNIPIDTYLFSLQDLKKIDVLAAISQLTKIPSIDIASVAVDPQALGFISESIARKYMIIPINYNAKDNSILIASVDPYNLSLVDFLEKKTGKKIHVALAYADDIKKAIDMSYAQSLSPEVKEALQEVNQKPTVAVQEVGTVIKEAPIAKIVNTILEFAVRSRASDIHIEPLEVKTRVRYRIDGILQEKLSLPKSIHESLSSRIKILSQMKIDEKRIPQDGRFSFTLGVEEVDLRVSTLPTVHGEKIVMRLLKKTGGLPTLAELGLRGSQYKAVEEAIGRPYGIVLVTGPTGSGKTTTLYSMLNKLNKPGVNIVTLEDPVEYQIPGINQVQINVQAGLTFASGLRAFLRQDPNIILVGEIRDTETTQLAIQAALTGHLVFSTLHTNDAATAVPRLIDLGGEPFLVASVLNASIAQRIVRRVCNSCKTQFTPPQEVQNDVRTVLGDLLPVQYKEGEMTFSKGQGCSECNQTGYIGRIAIFEVINFTQSISKLVIKQSSANDIQNAARQEGMITMKQDGYLKVLEGLTTIEEILRVAEV